MVQKIIKLLAETAGIDYNLISMDLNLKDDLFLDENDIDEVLIELEDYFGVEFEEREKEFICVEDLISYVKEAV